jgi:hypothetical protein
LATVRNHIHNILDKLQVHSKLEAVSLAFRCGWVSDLDERERPPSAAAGRSARPIWLSRAAPAPSVGRSGISLRAPWYSR